MNENAQPNSLTCSFDLPFDPCRWRAQTTKPSLLGQWMELCVGIPVIQTADFRRLRPEDEENSRKISPNRLKDLPVC